MKSFWLALIAAIIWGITPIVEKIGLNSKVDPAVGVIFRTAGAVVGAFVLFIFLMQTDAASHLRKIDTRALLFLGIGGVMASIIAQIFFYMALQAGDASYVTPIVGAYPLITFILGVLLLGETITLQKVAGVVLVISGVVLLK